jgi:hypothetical protein
MVFIIAGTCWAQSTSKIAVPKTSTISNAQSVKFSPAYAEVLLRKTERESELEEFLLDYTEEFPKVKELKFEIGLLQKEADKIIAVNASESAKLTLALGKLIVRKTEIETDLWNLRRQYADDHAEVKRARRKIEVYEKAIKEILP